ncbi:GTP-binding protein rho5 [Coprinopsis sp. MPI-PUGE-AT-0042]|nr:GTP-binding protein rho5 [Coprinopsis sp. MPI-PUGE-AT-0042]
MTVPIKRKLVIVGDGDCGKTCLLTTFVKGKFPDVYVPTVIEPELSTTTITLESVRNNEGEPWQIELSLWDTEGDMNHERLRPLSYPGAHVFLICFSIDSPESLDNVLQKRAGEVIHFCPEVPIILVGCKKDLRNSSATLQKLEKMNQRPVSLQEVKPIKQAIGAKYYLECSAKTGEGLHDLFQHAANVASSSGVDRCGSDAHPSRRRCVVT